MKTKIFVTAASTLVVLAACSNDAEKHSAKTEPAKVVMQDKAGDDKAAAGDTEVNPRLLRRLLPFLGPLRLLLHHDRLGLGIVRVELCVPKLHCGHAQPVHRPLKIEDAMKDGMLYI